MHQITVVGAGTMGHGIAQVCAMAGFVVHLTDTHLDPVQRGLDHITANLDKGVARGKVDDAVRDRALDNLTASIDLDASARDSDLIIEAIPESLELKRQLFGQVEAVAPSHCIFASNTSSLSIGAIAAELADPGRVVGTHFFNPVHIMALLELVVADSTRADVVETVKAFGIRIGKEVIIVRDTPGFATSRLGITLGMEAIRMVEDGVASPEDIDKAMVLGYRHPIGPLRLTDLVGLDVRMAIGTYLARELDNPAFSPPELLRRMVKEGKLGKKTGEGFYRW